MGSSAGPGGDGGPEGFVRSVWADVSGLEGGGTEGAFAAGADAATANEAAAIARGHSQDDDGFEWELADGSLSGSDLALAAGSGWIWPAVLDDDGNGDGCCVRFAMDDERVWTSDEGA